MKNLLFIALLLCSFSLTTTSCSDEDPITTVIDSARPVGDLTVSRTGSIVEQNNTGSQGLVELGQDDESNTFLRFGDDFQTALATGTVTVYLSTSEEYVPDPANGNPDLLLVGLAQSNGEQFYKIDRTVDAKFTHMLLWCASANVPFGYAELSDN